MAMISFIEGLPAYKLVKFAATSSFEAVKSPRQQ